MANKKTNKTSHVMNLLTNGAPDTSGSAETAGDASVSPDSSVQEKKGDIQSHTVTPKKVTVVDEGSRNDRLSQEILSKLSEELDEEEVDEEAMDGAEEAASEADADPAPEESLPDAEDSPSAEAPVGYDPVSGDDGQASEAEPAGEPADQEEDPGDVDLSAADENASEPVQPSKAHHAIIPKSQLNKNLLGDAYSFVNIMEQLILRQDIHSFLVQYNVCTCPRCMADVCALALSGMPPKYVVTSKDSISPLLSYYESRNKILMLTELIKACNKVRENPRHDKR